MIGEEIFHMFAGGTHCGVDTGFRRQSKIRSRKRL